MNSRHVPVLKNELIELLKINKGDIVVDCTLGGGGHAKDILKLIGNEGKMYAFDIDIQAIERFNEYLKLNVYSNVKLVNDNFKNIDKHTSSKVNAIYADLGFSTDQLDSDLSYKRDGELDLRMDKSLGVKASDLVNVLYENELVKIFEDYSDEPLAKLIAKEIIFARKKEPIKTKFDLIKIINNMLSYRNINKSKRSGKPEARIFQALRIAVNDEYNSLNTMINKGFDLLVNNGKMAIISFHSGEDRITKQNFKKLIKENKAEWIEELVVPSEKEIDMNNKSKSAKLRVIKKIVE